MAFGKDDQIGALWERKTRTGNHMLSGKVKLPGGGELDIVCFWNDKKQEGEKTPDWRIFRGEPRQGQERGSGTPGPARQPARGSSGGRTGGEGPPAPRTDHELDDDIPF